MLTTKDVYYQEGKIVKQRAIVGYMTRKKEG